MKLNEWNKIIPVLCLLAELGISVSFSKTCLYLTQILQFIRVKINILHQWVCLPEEKKPLNLCPLAQNFIASPTQSTHTIQCLLGFMAATTLILSFVRLHMWMLQFWFLWHFWPALQPQSPYLIMSFPYSDKSIITLNTNLLCSMPFELPPPEIIIIGYFAMRLGSPLWSTHQFIVDTDFLPHTTFPC